MKPQDYSARTAYRVPAAWYRRLNGLGVLPTSLGLAPRDAVTLHVRGRTSGKVRRVPILRTRYREEDYLVSLAGESQWVRNVRAARATRSSAAGDPERSVSRHSVQSSDPRSLLRTCGLVFDAAAPRITPTKTRNIPNGGATCARLLNW